MINYPKILSNILRNPFFIALLLLIAYLLTNTYIYGWDDQHLEIPILKRFIDPGLYKGDYYVESLCKYFTSWMYPVLAHFITLKQVPTAYFIIFIISRYFMFYWVYRLWYFISGSCFAAISAASMFFLLGRTEEFLYRSLCHEELSYIFMFAGFYFQYRERYLLAALVWGLGVDIHAIYNLFPMLYMLGYLFFCHPNRIKICIQTSLCFILTSLPFLCWQIPISMSRELVHPVPASEWIPLYLLSCPQNFLFGDTAYSQVLSNLDIFLEKGCQYLLLTGLFLFHLVFNQQLRKDKKVWSVVVVSWILIGVVFYFDYIHPSRFVLDLNLVRVEQFVRFFLMGYTTIWAFDQALTQRPWYGLAAGGLILITATTDIIALCYITFIAMIFSLKALIELPKPFRLFWTVSYWIFASWFINILFNHIKNYPFLPILMHRYQWTVLAMGVVFIISLFKFTPKWFRSLFLVVPLLGGFINFYIFAQQYQDAKAHGSGFWQLQRNWEDMQRFVRDNTPKDALILTPYDMDMGGFRIHSERKVLVCYRDCGIIGFDYAAAVEWQKRIKDIEEFKVFTNKPIDHAVLNAVFKYKVNYIVFMNYYQPPSDNPIVKKIYQNEVFALYQVLINPVN